MAKARTFQKIDSCTYRYAGGDFMVEKLLSGKWCAYLLDACGHALWASHFHPTRKSAAIAIGAERRRISKELRKALSFQSEAKGLQNGQRRDTYADLSNVDLG